MSDSDSSDDDLGLFSFANKKAIVARPPESSAEIISEVCPDDMSLFKRNDKRKRTHAPWIIQESANQSEDGGQAGSAADNADTSTAEEKLIDEKMRQYDNHIASVCNIDDHYVLELQQGGLPASKKFKKTTENRNKLLSNLDGVLNKYKQTIDAVEDDPMQLPETSCVLNTERTIVVKMRKGNNIHRFKIKRDSPLEPLLEHVAPHYNAPSSHIILQLNDETIDPTKSPSQLGITVADIVDVLIGPAPRHTGSVGQQVPVQDVNAMKIKIQSTEHRNNQREYTVLRNKPLEEYLLQACRDFGYQAAKYYFDGETVTLKKTPDQLDMEELDCIDIVEQKI